MSAGVTFVPVSWSWGGSVFSLRALTRWRQPASRVVGKKKVWLRPLSKLDPNEWELPKEPRIFQKNIDFFLKNPRIGGPPTKKTSEKCFGVTSLAACGGPPPHYDYRPDLKAQYTSIIRARDEGELSLAAAQLNGVLRRKVTYHGHDGVRALYARFAPDASLILPI